MPRSWLRWATSGALLLALVLGLWLPTVSRGAGGHIQPAVKLRYLVVPNTKSFGGPVLVGSQMAYVNEAPTGGQRTWSIYAGNINHWKPRFVTGSGLGRFQGCVYDLQMSRRWMAWEGIGCRGQGPGTYWYLLARDRWTGRVYLVDSSVRDKSPQPAWVGSPIALWGNSVAWTYNTCIARCRALRPVVRHVLAFERLSSGKRQIIDNSSSCWAYSPSLAKSKLVYTEMCSGRKSTSEIVMRNLATGRASVLSHSGGTPVTNGSKVAWIVDNSSHPRVALLDLATGRRQIVSRPCHVTVGYQCHPQGRSGNAGPWPALTISPRTLVWAGTDDSSAGAYVIARDLATGKEYRLPDDIGTDGRFSDASPSNTVVWPLPNAYRFGIGLATIP